MHLTFTWKKLAEMIEIDFFQPAMGSRGVLVNRLDLLKMTVLSQHFACWSHRNKQTQRIGYLGADKEAITS